MNGIAWLAEIQTHTRTRTTTQQQHGEKRQQQQQCLNVKIMHFRHSQKRRTYKHELDNLLQLNASRGNWKMLVLRINDTEWKFQTVLKKSF